MVRLELPNPNTSDAVTSPISVSTNDQLAFLRNRPANGPDGTQPFVITDEATPPHNDQPANGGAGGNNPGRTPAEVHSMIWGPERGGAAVPYLGSASYREREQVDQALGRMRLAAVPQLLQGTASEDPEISGRSNRIIARILDNRDPVGRVNENELLSLRNQQHRDDFLRRSLGRDPTAQESARFLGAINHAFAGRLAPREIQQALTELDTISTDGDSGKWKFNRVDQSISDRSLAMADHLRTPEGRAELRLERARLEVINDSPNATVQERSEAARQAASLTRALSPGLVQRWQVLGRVAQAEGLLQNPFPGSEQTAHNRMVQAYQLASTEPLQQRVIGSVVAQGLDQSPAFMPAFVQARGGTPQQRDAFQQLVVQQGVQHRLAEAARAAAKQEILQANGAIGGAPKQMPPNAPRP